MEAKKYAFLICKIGIVLLVLTSCNASISTTPPQPDSTLSPSFLPSPSLTHKSTRTLIPLPPTLTFVPTLPAEHEQHLEEMLQAGDCKLPCYLGITPGKTTLSTAKVILENLGASYAGEYKRKNDDGIEYTYDLDIGGQPGLDETPMPDGGIVTVYHRVSLITNNDVVQIIETGPATAGPGVSTVQALAKVREYWSRYTAKGIFMQLGLPDQLYIDKPDPFTNKSIPYLLIIYEKLGVVAQIYGSKYEDNICAASGKSIDIQLSLFNTANSLLTIYNDGRVPPTDRSVWLPIQEVLGVNVMEFYNRVISDSSACF